MGSVKDYNEEDLTEDRYYYDDGGRVLTTYTWYWNTYPNRYSMHRGICDTGGYAFDWNGSNASNPYLGRYGCLTACDASYDCISTVYRESDRQCWLMHGTYGSIKWSADDYSGWDCYVKNKYGIY